MKCQILFSGKNISKCHLPKILPRVLSVKVINNPDTVPKANSPLINKLKKANHHAPFIIMFTSVKYDRLGQTFLSAKGR